MHLLFYLPLWMFIKIWVIVIRILPQFSKDYLFLPFLLCSDGEMELPVCQKVI